jgi:osmoprotectant transport system ATP-binding protein
MSSIMEPETGSHCVIECHGVGKTTTLKLINRLLEPTEGDVRLMGRSTRDWDPISLRRRIGYVIQEIGLLPHLTVEGNVGLVPRLEGWDRDRVSARVRELLTLVDLDPDRFSGRRPHQLSGGQRQRGRSPPIPPSC